MLPQYYTLYCEVALRYPVQANDHPRMTAWLSSLDWSCFDSERYRNIGILLGRRCPIFDKEQMGIHIIAEGRRYLSMKACR